MFVQTHPLNVIIESTVRLGKKKSNNNDKKHRFTLLLQVRTDGRATGVAKKVGKKKLEMKSESVF